jgi:hypothetical protein
MDTDRSVAVWTCGLGQMRADAGTGEWYGNWKPIVV